MNTLCKSMWSAQEWNKDNLHQIYDAVKLMQKLYTESRPVFTTNNSCTHHTQKGNILKEKLLHGPAQQLKAQKSLQRREIKGFIYESLEYIQRKWKLSSEIFKKKFSWTEGNVIKNNLLEEKKRNLSLFQYRNLSLFQYFSISPHEHYLHWYCW